MSIPDFLMIDSTVCNILRLTPDVDHELGASPGTFEIIAIDVVCSLDREQSISNRYGGGADMDIQGITYQATFKMITLADTDIISGDRVTIAGVEYDVNDVISFSTHRECILSKST